MVIKDDAFFYYNMLMVIKMILFLLQHVDGDKDGDAVSVTKY